MGSFVLFITTLLLVGLSSDWIIGFFAGIAVSIVFGGCTGGEDAAYDDCSRFNAPDVDHVENFDELINPCNGLPMMNGSIDTAGNCFGFGFDHNSF